MMQEIGKAFQRYWEKRRKDMAKDYNDTLIKAARESFHAGYEKAMKDRDCCTTCGKSNGIHPAMFDCHGCRTKHY